MQMSAEEICRDYRQAKDPRAQIRILADLNACSPAHIKKILQEGGEAVAVPGRPAKAPAQRSIDKAAAAERAKAADAPADPAPAPEEKPGHDLPKPSPARDYVEKMVERRKALAAELSEIDRELYGLVHMIADGTEKK